MSCQSVLNLIGALAGMGECLAGRLFFWQPSKDVSYLGLVPAFGPENVITWCHLDIPSSKILKTSQIFRHVIKAENFLRTESQQTTSNKELEKEVCKMCFRPWIGWLVLWMCSFLAADFSEDAERLSCVLLGQLKLGWMGESVSKSSESIWEGCTETRAEPFVAAFTTNPALLCWAVSWVALQGRSNVLYEK